MTALYAPVLQPAVNGRTTGPHERVHYSGNIHPYNEIKIKHLRYLGQQIMLVTGQKRGKDTHRNTTVRAPENQDVHCEAAINLTKISHVKI